MEPHPISAIGWISSPYKEKFGAPRQPNEVPAAEGYLHFHPEYRVPEAWRGIEGFSHLWVLFQFHLAADKDWRPTVRPPRLGGNQRIGVFATRSPFRPNSIGMSVLTLIDVETHPKHGLSIKISGLDLIDGTPIYDVKPYLPHADNILNASTGFSPPKITKLPIKWLCDYTGEHRALIEQTLAIDPRPAYKTGESTYGCLLADLNVTWRVVGHAVEILSVLPVSS